MISSEVSIDEFESMAMSGSGYVSVLEIPTSLRVVYLVKKYSFKTFRKIFSGIIDTPRKPQIGLLPRLLHFTTMVVIDGRLSVLGGGKVTCLCTLNSAHH